MIHQTLREAYKLLLPTQMKPKQRQLLIDIPIFFRTRCLKGKKIACNRSKAMMAMFINEPTTSKLISTIITKPVQTSNEGHFHRLQNTPDK